MIKNSVETVKSRLTGQSGSSGARKTSRPVIRLDHVQKTERDTLKFRLLALLVITFVLYLRREDAAFYPAAALVTGYIVYSWILRQFLMPRFMGVPLLYVMMTADLGTALGALYLFGTGTVLFALVPAMIAYYAIYLGYYGSLPAAVMGSFGYIGISQAVDGQISEIIAVQVPFFFILALLSGYLGQQRFREREERFILQQLMDTEIKAKGLMESVKRLDEGLTFSSVVQDIVKSSGSVTGLPFCVLLRLDEGKQRLTVISSNVEGLDPGLSEPTGKNTSAAITFDRPGELFTWSKLAAEIPSWLASKHFGTIVSCSIPGSNADSIAVAYLLDGAQRDLTTDTINSIKAFAVAAGKTLQNAILYTEAQNKSKRFLSDLEQAIESLGRFRETRTKPGLRVGPLAMEPQRQRAILSGTDLQLTKAEFDLLYILAENAGNPVNESMLLKEVWEKDNSLPQGNIVNVTVHRLRKKLSTHSDSEMIQTVRGRGYMISPPK